MTESQAAAGRFVAACDAPVFALCNTPDKKIRKNFRINGARDLKWVSRMEAHTGIAVICGSGPSLKECLPEIYARAKAGQYIFAINGAAQFLADRGIKPVWFITLDMRPENVKFVKSRPTMRYLIGSNCAPELFDELAGEDVGVIHPAGYEDLEDCLPTTRSICAIGGGHTSGLTALCTAHTLGFREIHLYGYDSCDAPGGESHAFEQSEGVQEQRRLRIRVGDNGVEFSCSFAMYAQAKEFPKYARMLADEGSTVSVHGDGLLPVIAREMIRPVDASKACYDLGGAPASYDFTAWLMIAEMARRRENAPGPLKVAFKPGPADGFRNDFAKEFAADHRQMMVNVLRPALQLVGAVEDDSALDGGYWHNRYTYLPIVEAARAGEPVPLFAAPQKKQEAAAWWLREHAVNRPVTITLRESSHWPARNSRLLNWLRFAGYLKGEGFDVVFVRDTEKAYDDLNGHLICPVASRDVLFRFALYERSLCNLFVANGPAGLAFFSDRPWLVFCALDPAGKWTPGTDAWWKRNHGIGNGEQFPWSSPQQKIVWDTDDYATIRSAWDGLNLTEKE